jgi:hypothetical protein
VLYGDGAGTFPRRTETGFGEAPGIIALGDLDGDGWPDVVTANGDGSVSVLLNGPPF